MKVLDYFGEILVKEVRDRSIEEWDMILDGRMKGVTAAKVQKQIVDFDDQTLQFMKWVIPQIVDTSLHHLLVMLEENEAIDVQISIDQEVESPKELSDGLAGEMCGEDGWIMRFSEMRYDETE